MLVVLGLIDVVMIAHLLVMAIVGGHETFVSRLNLKGRPDEPEWLSHVNAGVLKVELAAALIGGASELPCHAFGRWQPQQSSFSVRNCFG